ncbi:MAG TPA: hypothetical protein VM182_05275, partial [Terriglobia bacterium]|nr:hypothetical protein [Terriglobia bacterium]
MGVPPPGAEDTLGEPQDDRLLTVLQISWEQTRHSETLRLQYANLYLLALASALALSIQQTGCIQKGLVVYAWIFLLLVPVAWFVFTFIVKTN